jgi:hypothetical protein
MSADHAVHGWTCMDADHLKPELFQNEQAFVEHISRHQNGTLTGDELAEAVEDCYGPLPSAFFGKHCQLCGLHIAGVNGDESVEDHVAGHLLFLSQVGLEPLEGMALESVQARGSRAISLSSQAAHSDRSELSSVSIAISQGPKAAEQEPPAEDLPRLSANNILQAFGGHMTKAASFSYHDLAEEEFSVDVNAWLGETSKFEFQEHDSSPAAFERNHSSDDAEASDNSNDGFNDAQASDGFDDARASDGSQRPSVTLQQVPLRPQRRKIPIELKLPDLPEQHYLADIISRSFAISTFDTQERNYLPASCIKGRDSPKDSNGIVTKVVVERELIRASNHESYSVDRLAELVDWIVSNARKVFAITVQCHLDHDFFLRSIINFHKYNFDDGALPIDNPKALVDGIPRPPRPEAFPAKIWLDQQHNEFFQFQWTCLAPVFATGQYEYDLPSQCILPFQKVADTAPTFGSFSSVFKVTVHGDHQKRHSSPEAGLSFVASKQN